MAPRKAKILTKTQTIDETPVVFFLKITEEVENEIIPAGETNSYSELDKSGNIDNISYSNILNSVEIFNKPSKFNTDLLNLH